MSRLSCVGGIVAALLVLTSCSARYDFTECESDGDCRPFEQPTEGTFLTCGSDNTCVEASDIECRSDDHCSGGTCNAGTCSSDMTDAGDVGPDGDVMPDTDEMPDAGDAMDGGDTDVPTSCQTNSECIDRFGEDWICGIDQQCMKATNQICPELHYQNEERDDVVILGSLIPSSGPFETVGTTLNNAIQMAVGEYFDSARSLPSGDKIAWLECDPKGSGELALNGARHLIKAGAPAIVGPLLSQNYLDVVDQVTADAGVVTVAPAATSPAISNLAAAGSLSFRTIGNDRFQSNAMLDRIKELIGDNPDPNITVFYKNDQYGRDFQSELLDLILDADWIDKSDFAFLETVDPIKVQDESKVAMNFASQVTEALNKQQPGADLVVFIGTGEMIQLSAVYIKTAFGIGTAETNPLGKRYVFSHGAVSDIPSIVSVLEGNKRFVPLVEGISPRIIDLDNFPVFNSRYNAQFDQELTASAAGVAYDAANLVMLAMAGVPTSQELTGTNIGKVLADGKLQDDNGKTIEFGESGFQGTATAELRNGNTVDLQGVSGGLNLDSNGEIRSDYMGIDAGMKRDIGNNIVYDIVPTRIYQLGAPPATSGIWNPVPPGVQSPGVVRQKTPMSPIPDNDPMGVTVTADVQMGCGTVNVAHIGVNVKHPSPEELNLSLESPAGETVPLHGGTPVGGPNLEGSYPTTLYPAGDFSKLLAKNGNGTWKLTAVDTSDASGSGMLAGWGMMLYCGQ